MTIPLWKPHPFDAVFGDEVKIYLSRGQERRIWLHEQRMLVSDPEGTPEGEPWEETLNILISALIDRALDESETDAGVRYACDGSPMPLYKVPWKRRVKRAWRVLRYGR